MKVGAVRAPYPIVANEIHLLRFADRPTFFILGWEVIK